MCATPDIQKPHEVWFSKIGGQEGKEHKEQKNKRSDDQKKNKSRKHRVSEPVCGSSPISVVPLHYS